MAFKMKGFSPFTKETRYEGPRGGGSGEGESKKMKLEKKTGTIRKTSKANIEELKQKLYNMENPNSAEGKKMQTILDDLGGEWRGMNPDAVD